MSTASVAIAVAPNGGRRTKADHPALPITVEDLARDARACREAGAAMIHAHIRDVQGRHLLDADTYRAAIAAIAREIGRGLVIQITSESVGRYAPEAQMAVVKAVRPEAVSLALRELAPDSASEPAFAEFLGWLRREHVVPQIILYSAAEAQRFADLTRRGVIPFERLPVLFVLGSYAGTRDSEPADLEAFLAPPLSIPAHWMVCAFGRHEADCLVTTAQRGGHARVGFENNLQQADARPAIDNASQVRALAARLQPAGFALQGADDLRAAWATN